VVEEGAEASTAGVPEEGAEDLGAVVEEAARGSINSRIRVFLRLLKKLCHLNQRDSV
jgi:hypothetical protein